MDCNCSRKCGRGCSECQSAAPCQPEMLPAGNCVNPICGEGEMFDQLFGMPLGMAYVPWQEWDRLYDPDQGFCCGTLFEELNKPFMACRPSGAGVPEIFDRPCVPVPDCEIPCRGNSYMPSNSFRNENRKGFDNMRQMRSETNYEWRRASRTGTPNSFDNSFHDDCGRRCD